MRHHLECEPYAMSSPALDDAGLVALLGSGGASCRTGSLGRDRPQSRLTLRASKRALGSAHRNAAFDRAVVTRSGGPADPAERSV
jgi:hypothetical protein